MKYQIRLITHTSILLISKLQNYLIKLGLRPRTLN